MIQNAAFAEKLLEMIPHIKNIVQSQAVLAPSLYLDISWVLFDYNIYFILMGRTKNLKWRTTHRKYLIHTFVCMCVKTLRSLNIENYYVWTYWLCPIKCYFILSLFILNYTLHFYPAYFSIYTSLHFLLLYIIIYTLLSSMALYISHEY